VQRVLPNFFIIGAAKAGTTTLWHLLRQHPDVFMPDLKEPWFLSHDERYARGWDWYSSLFLSGSGVTAVGEASSCYCVTSLYPDALRRLGEYFPQARLIYCVREPYGRIESAWKQSLGTRRSVPREFSLAVQTHAPLIEGSRYGAALRAYLEVFSRDQIHIVLFDELIRDPMTTYRGCLQFLGVDPTYTPDDIGAAKNPSRTKNIDTPAYRVLRHSRAGEIAAGLAPTVAKRLVRRLLRKPMPEAVWTPGLREYVSRSLDNDTRLFVELAGLDRTLWTDAPSERRHEQT
jgi:hypothetical protein